MHPSLCQTTNGKSLAIRDHDLHPADDSSRTSTAIRSSCSLTSPTDLLYALQSEPDSELLLTLLKCLVSTSDNPDGFDVRRPSPKAAQILFVLINEIIPSHWDIVLQDLSPIAVKSKKLLLRCFSSIAGLGAIVSCARSILDQLKATEYESGPPGQAQHVEIILNFLEHLLQDDDFVIRVWRYVISSTKSSAQVILQLKELVPLLASGRLLSTVSEAYHALNKSSPDLKARSWVGDGSQYAAWLGRNVHVMICEIEDIDMVGKKALSQIVSRALSLGSTDQFIETLSSDLARGAGPFFRQFQCLLRSLSAHDQRCMIYSLIRIYSKRHLSLEMANGTKARPESSNSQINGIGAFLAMLTDGISSLRDALVEWLTSISAEAVSHNSSTHRAVIVALLGDHAHVQLAFQKTLQLFGDKLFIKHSPMLHQEVNAQILLLLAGYIFRTNAERLVNCSKSSVYVNGISNHLAAPSPRARFLGMVVGTAVSELVDPKGRRLQFDAEETSSEECRWYRRLTTINDRIGSMKDLRLADASSVGSSTKRERYPIAIVKTKQSTGPEAASSKIVSIEEISNASESEDDDLPLYAKPDSDVSDDDEDPILVQRERPTAPVYIRDLLFRLRDTENHDNHTLALKQAATLIRRKSSFGSEVSDNIEELVTVLVGLTDRWEHEDFQKLRLQAMIAVLVAQPLEMGQWFSRTFYSGDYSLAQRASMLTTMGLGAREVAGLGKDDATLMGAAISTPETFPSKRLPEKLHHFYLTEAAPMNALSAQLEKAMIQPLAAEAADKVTGPNALKVRTFSSRMEVEKKRQKPASNALAKIVAQGFFFPLIGHWRIQLQTHGDNNPQTSPFLLNHLLRTLSLILHASGTSAVSLPQMTSEFWDLLLSIRPRAVELTVLEALLFSLLTIFEINQNDQRTIAEEHAKKLLETQQWVEGIFEQVGGGSEEGEKVRMLAAGVLVRAREVVEKYQRLLLGDLADFM